MGIEDLIYLIQSGESETLEFKETEGRHVHHEIAAFANSDGGTILVGVSDAGKIIGTSVKEAIEKITSSIHSIIPPPKIRTQKISIDDKDILVVTREKSHPLLNRRSGVDQSGNRSKTPLPPGYRNALLRDGDYPLG